VPPETTGKKKGRGSLLKTGQEGSTEVEAAKQYPKKGEKCLGRELKVKRRKGRRRLKNGRDWGEESSRINSRSNRGDGSISRRRLQHFLRRDIRAYEREDGASNSVKEESSQQITLGALRTSQ